MRQQKKISFHLGFKNNAGWWAEGTIDDDSFIQGIQFLINTGAIIVPEMENLKMENAELQKKK